MSETRLTAGGLKSLDELNKFQYIRKEFTTPTYEPKITLNYDTLAFNAACVRIFPDSEYIQILVDDEAKRIVVWSCDRYDKDAIKWSVIKDNKPKSRTVRAKIACAKLFELMNWNIDYRYKIISVYQELESLKLLVFNLTECEMLVPTEVSIDGNIKKKRKKVYPIDWEQTFGTPFGEHKKTFDVDISKYHLLSDSLPNGTTPPSVEPRIPTASELITREYYVPDVLKKGGNDNE